MRSLAIVPGEVRLKIYEAEVGSLLDGVLRPAEQRQMSDYVSRLLTAIDQEA